MPNKTKKELSEETKREADSPIFIVDMNYKALGKQIRRHRQLKGLTQEHLASRSGISASFLGHIERGSRKASLETLANLANALQVGADKLLCDSLAIMEDNSNRTAKMNAFLRKVLLALEEEEIFF